MFLAFAAGAVLGILFFGGLWLTVRQAVTAKLPALWVMVSFFLRIGLTLTGLYYIGADNWQRLIIALLGFLAARLAITQYTRTPDLQVAEEKQVVIHGT